MTATGPAFVLPRQNASTLCCFVETHGYRETAERLFEVSKVPMPLRAEHVLDLDAGLLVYAEGGSLVAVSGLGAGEPSALTTTRVPLPAGFEVRALALRRGVVFVGGRGAREMLGAVALHGEAWFRPLPLELEPAPAYQGVERLVLHQDRLHVLGDLPLHVYDIAEPRNVRLVKVHSDRFLDPRPASAAAGDRLVATLSARAPVGGATVTVIDLPTHERCMLDTTYHERLADLRAVALAGEVLVLAAGAAGVGVLPVEPSWLRPPAGPAEVLPSMLLFDSESMIAAPRFVRVGAGSVVGVVPVDRTRAFAITEHEGRRDSVLVRIG